MKMSPKKISIILTTYNRPSALALVLSALQVQENIEIPFEVLIADDGSTAETKLCLQHIVPTLKFPVRHVWQTDMGFRAARSRNRALAVARGDYIIFLDGDCIPFPDFLYHHVQLAEFKWFIAGNRILMNKALTLRVIDEKIPIWYWHARQWIKCYLKHEINRLLPLWRLPEGTLRKRFSNVWQGAKTCNLAVWRSDLIRVNGFDERFQGWGHEDADLAIRLIRSGVLRKEGRFAVPVMHLWHPDQDRSQEAQNRVRLQEILQNAEIKARCGVDQYLDTHTMDSDVLSNSSHDKLR
jgi:glycosyltransferase involved in cell wall biosynthesis